MLKFKYRSDENGTWLGSSEETPNTLVFKEMFYYFLIYLR